MTDYSGHARPCTIAMPAVTVPPVVQTSLHPPPDLHIQTVLQTCGYDSIANATVAQKLAVKVMPHMTRSRSHACNSVAMTCPGGRGRAGGILCLAPIARTTQSVRRAITTSIT